MALPVDIGVMTVGAIAVRDGISRQAVAKMVSRLVSQHGLPVDRDRRGRVIGIDIQRYDELRGAFGDSAQIRSSIKEPSAAPDQGTDATIDGARRLKTIEETRLLRMRVAAEADQLIRRDRHKDAVLRLADEITRQIDVTRFVERLAGAYTKGDLHGLRVEAKKITVEMRTRVADACAGIALLAPERDDPLDIEEAEAA